MNALVRKDEDDKNYLACSSEALDLALQHFPHSLNVSTLTKVAESAGLYRQISNSKFDFHHDYKPSFPQFQFHDRTWTMTKTLLKTDYANKEYQIIHFKLPNDGFIYSGKGIQVNKDHPEISAFIARMTKAVLQIKDFSPEVRIKYRPSAG